MKTFLTLLRHDLRFHIRHTGDWAALILFFLIVLILLPFAIGPEPDMLRRMAPGFIWLAALLMTFLALDRLFVADARDGTLDLMLLSPTPLPIIVFSKLASQSLIMIMVLVLMLGPAAIMLNMNPALLPTLALSFLLGVPSLVLLGGIAGAITVSLRRNPALLTLLLIPFYIPILIFAVASCDAKAMQEPAAQPLLLLAAILAFLLPTAPFIIASALKEAGG